MQARHFRQLRGSERLVHAFSCKIEIERFREQRQRVDLERQLLDLRPLVLGFRLGGRRHGVDEVGDLDVVRIAAEARHLGLERSVIAPADFDARINHEDHFAPARAKYLAAAARAGLDDDRVTLRRARHRERPARAEIAAFVIEAVNFFGFGEQSGRLVLDDGVVLPGVPMAEHDLHEFVGAVVAQIVCDRLVAAHVLRFAVVERRHYVPGGAAARHQIEGGEHARHMERLVVAGRISGAEAEALRRHAHHREHGDGVELHATNAMFDGVGMIAAIHVRHRQPVVEEAEVKLALLQHAADVPVKIRRPAIGARSRMAPGAGEVGAVLRLQEADQNHLAHRRGPSREGNAL